jgi:hypothetical protein
MRFVEQKPLLPDHSMTSLGNKPRCLGFRQPAMPIRGPVAITDFYYCHRQRNRCFSRYKCVPLTGGLGGESEDYWGAQGR